MSTEATPLRSELALMRRAAARKWNVPDSLKDDCVEAAGRIVRENPNPRHILKAIQTLASLDMAERREERKDRELSILQEATLNPELAERALRVINGDDGSDATPA